MILLRFFLRSFVTRLSGQGEAERRVGGSAGDDQTIGADRQRGSNRRVQNARRHLGTPARKYQVHAKSFAILHAWLEEFK